MAGLLVVIYAAFISLGLPDSVLGSAWPVMYPGFGVASGLAGAVSMTTSACTIISALASDRLTRRFGTGVVTLVSVFLTAGSLAGFAVAPAFWVLCLLAIPLGLGAGSIDAALNNFVAIHYSATHMNWLHACWGLGASIGPLIMGQYLAANASWRLGYATIAAIQGVLALVLLGTIGMWRVAVPHGQGDRSEQAAHSSLLRTLGLPRAKAAVVVFVAYCALEGSTMLWSSTFLVHVRGFPAGLAATFGALYVFGITAGRIISGFLALRIRPHRLVWLGIGSVLVGLAVLLLGWTATAAVGLILMGLGSGPIYPNMIHETPRLFGAESSQAMIGLEMAGANLGILVFPALFGGIAALFGYVILPIYLIVIVAILALALWWLHILPESAVQRPQS